MAGKGDPTRGEFDRLKADFDRLRADVEALRDRVLQQTEELKTQFTRIAQMQAILDEERMASVHPSRRLPASRRRDDV
jgi:hypothetical protein